MRIDNSDFTVANKSANKEPIIVVEVAFDSANTDVYYFCTRSADGLSGANVINDCVKGVSGTSQKLNPDKALSDSTTQLQLTQVPELIQTLLKVKEAVS